MILGRIFLILLARVLVTILRMTLHILMGLNSEGKLGGFILGIKQIRVWFMAATSPFFIKNV